MLQLDDWELSAIDWIRSPLEVPMPTQSDVSAELEPPLGALGRVRVEVDSRMNEFEATGPVLKAGPMAAFTEEMAVAARTESIMEEGIVESDCLSGGS